MEPGLDEARLGSATIPFFHVPGRQDVDRVHARVTSAGYRSQKAPEDAFWGARYAIVEDPDGNAVGIMSPIDESMRRPPPPPPRTLRQPRGRQCRPIRSAAACALVEVGSQGARRTDLLKSTTGRDHRRQPQLSHDREARAVGEQQIFVTIPDK